MVGCTIHLKKRKPEWLKSLLRSEFFGSCEEHQNIRKNEKNMFCIDCNLSFCKHCLTTSSANHRLHRLLQICKYVYHFVVRLQDIQKYLNCSFIQTYKINGEKAVHLNPRPQSTDPKVSKSSKGGSFCEACRRHIQDFPNRFCSISCKVSIDSNIYKEQSNNKINSIPIPDFDQISINEENNAAANEDDDDDDDESNISRSESSDQVSQTQTSSSTLLKPKKLIAHKRKGVPRRASFL